MRNAQLPSVVLLLAAALVPAADPAVDKQTFVFKTVGDLKIEADLYRPADRTPRPVLVWIHGGALIMGSRTGVPGNFLDLCKKDGICLVSIDYRLAPEVKSASAPGGDQRGISAVFAGVGGTVPGFPVGCGAGLGTGGGPPACRRSGHAAAAADQCGQAGEVPGVLRQMKQRLPVAIGSRSPSDPG